MILLIHEKKKRILGVKILINSGAGADKRAIGKRDWDSHWWSFVRQVYSYQVSAVLVVLIDHKRCCREFLSILRGTDCPMAAVSVQRNGWPRVRFDAKIRGLACRENA
jgi:hypothetical protein